MDNDNVSGTRPDDITVRLYANGEPVDAKPTWKSKTGNSWSYVFDKLPGTDDSGRPITYTVDEDAVPCYETSIDGTTITNTLEEREDLMSLFGYKTPSAGLLPTGDEIPWWPIAFGLAGLLALLALLILEKKRRA